MGFFEKAKKGESQTYEISIVGKAGRRVSLNVTNIPIRVDGMVVGVYGLAKDISDRKEAEEALRESEARYRSIFDSVNDAIFVHDLETGKVIDVNAKMLELYGYPEGVIDGISVTAFSAYYPPHTEKEAGERLRKAAQEGPQVFEWQARKKNGETFWVEVNLKRAEIGEKEVILGGGPGHQRPEADRRAA